MKPFLKILSVLIAIGAVPAWIMSRNAQLAIELARVEAQKILNNDELLKKFDLKENCISLPIDNYDYDNFMVGFHQITFFTTSDECKITLRAELKNHLYNTSSDILVYGYISSNPEPLILNAN